MGMIKSIRSLDELWSKLQKVVDIIGSSYEKKQDLELLYIYVEPSNGCIVGYTFINGDNKRSSYGLTNVREYTPYEVITGYKDLSSWDFAKVKLAADNAVRPYRDIDMCDIYMLPRYTDSLLRHRTPEQALDDSPVYGITNK